MKHLLYHFAATVLVLCAACFTACNKASLSNSNNPVAVSLPAADFDITILDCEHGYDRDSNYVFEGVWKSDAFYFGLYKTEKMTPNITPDNAITFRITSDSPSFQGVNASSSKGGINIVQDGNDHTVYHLEWVAEGESEITFWNGEGEGRKTVSFTATSKNEIPLTGIKVRFMGIETKFERMYATEYEENVPTWLPIGTDPTPFISKRWEWHITQESSPSLAAYASEASGGWDGLEPLELFPIPLNATPKKYIADFYAKGAVSAEGYEYDATKTYKGSRRLDYEELYSENLAHFRGFSWIDSNSYKKDNAPTGTTSSIEDWANNHKDCQTVYPSDIRERKIIIPYTRSRLEVTRISLILYSGNLRDFSQTEVEQFTFYD